MSAASWLSSRVTVRRASGREADGAARLEDTNKPIVSTVSAELRAKLIAVAIARTTSGEMSKS